MMQESQPRQSTSLLQRAICICVDAGNTYAKKKESMGMLFVRLRCKLFISQTTDKESVAHDMYRPLQ